MTQPLQLAIDEIAVGIQLLAGDEAAYAFLRATMGALEDENAKGRLAAASHSLIARELLAVDPTTGAAALNSDLSAMIAVMHSSVSTIRCSKTQSGEPMDTTYFSVGESAVEFGVRLGVVARLEMLASPADVPSRVAAFARATSDTAPEEAVGTIGADVLQGLRELGSAATAEQLGPVFRQSVRGDAARALAHDVTRTKGDWGAVMKLEAGSDGSVVSNHGFFFLDAGPRVWLFDVTETAATATVYAGHPDVARTLARRLQR